MSSKSFDLQKFEQKVYKDKGQKEYLEEKAKKKTKELKIKTVDIRSIQRAAEILKQAAFDTQAQLEEFMNSLVSSALQSVFDEPYEFKLQFVERRGQIEADVFISDDGNLVDPVSGSFGVSDIASFALRIACLKLSGSRVRKVLLLDEPFKHLSDDLQTRASLLLRELSEKNDIQIIYVTQAVKNKGVIDNSHNVIHMKKRNGLSYYENV